LPLKVAREILNQKMQSNIDENIEQANFHYDCEKDFKKAEEYFYTNLNDKIGGYLWAKYELEIDQDTEIEKRHFNREQSIYKFLTPTDGIVLYMAKLGSVVNIGNDLVGTDKLGHFIGVGKSYFDRIRNYHQSLKQVMEYGESSEDSYFGDASTGIHSFGDLVSNYEGLLFWQNLFGGEHPMIKCQDGVLIRRKLFDWMDYISDAWDESINCSTYRNEKIRQKVIAGIKDNVSPTATCPLVKLSEETINRYSKTPVKILNTP
ncbi:MAG: hypothetical protein ACXVLQ_17090, partial [Bacteriovorax sp.]